MCGVFASAESPLTLAAHLDNMAELVKVLKGGGAHLDFRAKDGLTALHKAARSRNLLVLSVSCRSRRLASTGHRSGSPVSSSDAAGAGSLSRLQGQSWSDTPVPQCAGGGRPRLLPPPPQTAGTGVLPGRERLARGSPGNTHAQVNNTLR